MTKPRNPVETAKPAKKPEPSKPGELDEGALQTVSGGKTQLSDITITHTYDKASPKLG